MKKSEKQRVSLALRGAVAGISLILAFLGLGVSAGLLSLGLGSMALRYGLTVALVFLAAWGLFSLLIRSFRGTLPDTGASSSGKEKKNNPGSSLNLLGDALGEALFSELAWVLLPVYFLVIGVAGVLIFSLAPLSLAVAEIVVFESALGVSLIPALRRREMAARGALLKALAWPFGILLVISVVYGLVVQGFYPGTDSIGDLWTLIKASFL